MKGVHFVSSSSPTYTSGDAAQQGLENTRGTTAAQRVLRSHAVLETAFRTFLCRFSLPLAPSPLRVEGGRVRCGCFKRQDERLRKCKLFFNTRSPREVLDFAVGVGSHVITACQVAGEKGKRGRRRHRERWKPSGVYPGVTRQKHVVGARSRRTAVVFGEIQIAPHLFTCGGSGRRSSAHKTLLCPSGASLERVYPLRFSFLGCYCCRRPLVCSFLSLMLKTYLLEWNWPVTTSINIRDNLPCILRFFNTLRRTRATHRGAESDKSSLGRAAVLRPLSQCGVSKHLIV